MTGGSGRDGDAEVVRQEANVGETGEAVVGDVDGPGVGAAMEERIGAGGDLDGGAEAVAVRVAGRDRPGWDALVGVWPTRAVVAGVRDIVTVRVLCARFRRRRWGEARRRCLGRGVLGAIKSQSWHCEENNRDAQPEQSGPGNETRRSTRRSRTAAGCVAWAGRICEPHLRGGR